MKRSRFDFETARLQLHGDLQDKICKLKEKISKVENECKELESTTAKHNNESDADSYLPTHASYMEVMKGRPGQPKFSQVR